jgi:hypothetical protein
LVAVSNDNVAATCWALVCGSPPAATSLRAAARDADGDRAPPWEWLARHPRLDPSSVARLREWHDAAARGRPVPLARLHNLLLDLERRLA